MRTTVRERERKNETIRSEGTTATSRKERTMDEMTTENKKRERREEEGTDGGSSSALVVNRIYAQ